jgi:hypothetical protein
MSAAAGLAAPGSLPRADRWNGQRDVIVDSYRYFPEVTIHDIEEMRFSSMNCPVTEPPQGIRVLDHDNSVANTHPHGLILPYLRSRA